MKKNKFKRKKGMTLIEVIISVTLLSILIVPLSSIIMSSLRNSKSGEERQKASYIGQKVIEELKAYDYIKLDSEGSFQLLDGDKIKLDKDKNIFSGTFYRTIFGSVDESNKYKESKFKIEFTMKKNSNFDFSNIDYVDQIEAKYKITLEENYIIGADGSKLFELTDNSNNSINIDFSNNKIEIYNESSNKDINLDSTKKNIFIVNVKENYNKNININLSNNESSSLEVNLVKEGTSNNIQVNCIKGNILLVDINNVSTNIGDMYNYDVIVKDMKDNTLFKGSSSSNIIIK